MIPNAVPIDLPMMVYHNMEFLLVCIGAKPALPVRKGLAL